MIENIVKFQCKHPAPTPGICSDGGGGQDKAWNIKMFRGGGKFEVVI